MEVACLNYSKTNTKYRQVSWKLLVLITAKLTRNTEKSQTSFVEVAFLNYSKTNTKYRQVSWKLPVLITAKLTQNTDKFRGSCLSQANEDTCRCIATMLCFLCVEFDKSSQTGFMLYNNAGE